jgi:hypothetical protein
VPAPDPARFTSIPPRCDVGPCRRGLQDAFDDPGHEELRVPELRVRVRPCVVTVPAVLGAIPVIHLALVRRVRGLLEEFLDEG